MYLSKNTLLFLLNKYTAKAPDSYRDHCIDW